MCVYIIILSFPFSVKGGGVKGDSVWTYTLTSVRTLQYNSRVMLLSVHLNSRCALFIFMVLSPFCSLKFPSLCSCVYVCLINYYNNVYIYIIILSLPFSVKGGGVNGDSVWTCTLTSVRTVQYNSCVMLLSVYLSSRCTLLVSLAILQSKVCPHCVVVSMNFYVYCTVSSFNQILW